MIKSTDKIERYPGVYRGKVVNNKDPEDLNRLQVNIPQIHGPKIALWAWPCDQWTHGVNVVYPFVTGGYTDGHEGTAAEQVIFDRMKTAYTYYDKKKRPVPIGHGVWLMFEGGYPDKPVWIGVFPIVDKALQPSPDFTGLGWAAVDTGAPPPDANAG